MAQFLPINQIEMKERGWEEVDFVYVNGDSYVDHPSFGCAIITRLLESLGYKIGFLAQPDWKRPESFNEFGKPKLGFLVSAGNVDSMVNHYSVAKKRRDTDFYTAGGVMGKRPDYATVVYCNKIRELYPDSPIVIGGVEASLRRFAHYDYWKNEVFPSILIDAKADILSYGMGENSITEIASRLKKGEDVSQITDIRGTAYITRDISILQKGYVECGSYEKLRNDKVAYAKATQIQLDNQDYAKGKTIVQKHGDSYLVQNPPAKPLSQEEMDKVHNLQYQRTYHPSYEALGGVPSIKEVQFSIIHNRGCFGACNFCAITLHQGKYISSRSHDSVVKEAKEMVHHPEFKGYIHDVGGPTADFRTPSCKGQLDKGICTHRKCLSPAPCPNLEADHSDYVELLRKVRAIEGVKKVFIRSGIRFDYVMYAKDDTFLKEVTKHHVSGQLKVAPEHISDNVLKYMGKSPVKVYKEFSKKFYRFSKEAGKEQYLVPYLMSSHPGSTLKDAIELALFLKREKLRPEQVQDFYPTPGTVSTCMYYTGLDPKTLERVHVEKDPHQKAIQRALLQYFKPSNQHLVIEALAQGKRTDLIGSGPNCLVKPLPKQRRTKEITIHFNGVKTWQKGNIKSKHKRRK